jgi:hypothetical protein
LKAIGSGIRHTGRRLGHHSRRGAAAHRGTAPAVAAGAAGGAAVAATSSKTEAKTNEAKADTKTDDTKADNTPTTNAAGDSRAEGVAATSGNSSSTTSPPASAARAEATTDGAIPAASTTTAPAAPAQRSAALSSTKEEPLARDSEPRRGNGPASQPTQDALHLGVVGPASWPSAFEDVVGFALWPKDYGQRLRTHGIGDVLGTIFAPSGSAGRPTAKAGDPKAPVTASACDAPMSGDWPGAEIERSVELNADQRGALDQLKTSMGDAVKAIKATCRQDATLGPTERLRAMQSTLWAVHDAALLIRTPLAKFYDSLSDEQKKRFAAPAADPRSAHNMSRTDMARMCGMPSSNEMPVRHLEQSLHTNKAQQASLNTLQKKSFEMGQFLMASCLKPMAATPAERLDSAADRLTAVIFAASTMGLALNDFTSQLSDDQKSKLNSIGR